MNKRRLQKTDAKVPAVAPEVVRAMTMPSTRGKWHLYLGAGVASLIVLAAAVLLVYGQGISGWESALFGWANGLPDGLRPFMLALTELGGSWLAAGLVVVTCLFRLYRLSWRLATSIICSYGAVFLLKHVIARPRPEGLLENFQARIAEHGMGFPSNHTATATVVALTLWPYLPKGWRVIIAGLWIGLVALSRVYLGVHSPLDIIGGIAVGVIVVATIRLLPNVLRKWLRVA